jgi:very-short-patch-repair endonuclease
MVKKDRVAGRWGNDRDIDSFFEKIGLTVLRLSDDQVLNSINGIREESETYVANSRNRK